MAKIKRFVNKRFQTEYWVLETNLYGKQKRTGMGTEKVLAAISAVILFQIIFLANFAFLVYNEGYYKKEFSKVDTYSRVSEADILVEELVGYLKGENELSLRFNEREIAHMYDVKMLINKTLGYFLLLNVSFGLIVAVLAIGNKLKMVRKIIILSSVAVIAVAALFGLVSSQFPEIFNVFHITFFQPGSYIFPESDMLIRLFPQQFFYDFAFAIVLNSAITAVILLLLSASTFAIEKYK